MTSPRGEQSVARFVIVNGKVAHEDDVRSAVERLREVAGKVTVRVTGGPGDARRFGREAAHEGFGQVIACGGDGTINEIVSGLVPGFDGTLGIVPTGTANDFATCAGIPGGDPAAVAAALHGYDPVALDVGAVGGAAAGYFLNVATAGFGAEVSAEASEELKAVLGRVSYLVAGLASPGDIKPREATIVAPEFERTVAFYLLAVGNARCAGGGLPICPDADPTDGLFDVTIVPEGAVGATLAEIVRAGLEGVGEAAVRFRTSRLDVRANPSLQVNLDGEPASGDHFRFEVRPRALRVLLPPDSPLRRTDD
ncbi:MAG: YegS/Rv2252/BmrU family lipid kinase [Gemmatimonadales bacterium]|jgi:lipid kinase YegS